MGHENQPALQRNFFELFDFSGHKLTVSHRLLSKIPPMNPPYARSSALTADRQSERLAGERRGAFNS